MPEPSRRLFLSFAGDGSAFARAVADSLRGMGFAPWLEMEIKAGVVWEDQMREAMEASELVVLLISRDSLHSPSVNFEIGAAYGRGKRVLPIYLTEAAYRDAPSHLAATQAIKAYDLRPDEVAERIASTVEAVGSV